MRGLRVWQNKGHVSLRVVLGWCLDREQVDHLLVVNTPGVGERGRVSFDSAVERATKALLGNRMVDHFRATAWPGTQLMRHTAKVFVARFDAELMLGMSKQEDDLFQWTRRSPKRLPEDICLFRRGSDHPVLVSVTHENDAYIVAERDAGPPGFERTESSIKDLMLAWDGPYFCLR